MWEVKDLVRLIIYARDERCLLVDVISTGILCGGPFISDWLSLFHLAFLQDEVMTILCYFFCYYPLL